MSGRAVTGVARATNTRDSSNPVIPRPYDVLLGRGRTRWGGNQVFEMEIQRNALRYSLAETRHDKSSIVREIIRAVQAWGRFLDQEPPSSDAQNPVGEGEDGGEEERIGTGDWYLASYVKIRKKVGQVSLFSSEIRVTVLHGSV